MKLFSGLIAGIVGVGLLVGAGRLPLRQWPISQSPA